MPSEFDTLFEEVALPALFEQHGQSVTHIPKGVVTNSATVTAVFVPDEPFTDNDRGEGIIYRGELYVDDSLTLDEEDLWTINGNKWKTEENGEAEGGMVVVNIVRRKPIFTTTPDRVATGR